MYGMNEYVGLAGSNKWGLTHTACGRAYRRTCRIHLSPGLENKQGKYMAEMRPGGVKGGQIGQGYVTNPRTSR